jgi:hypothetical protein
MKSVLQNVLKTESKKNDIDYEIISEIVALNVQHDSSDSAGKKRRQSLIKQILENYIPNGAET